MTKPNTYWRNAALPKDTAVFAVGDIHAHHELLELMLKAIEDKILQLPPGTQAEVVFLGDYIDRGPDGKKTLDLLIAFEKKMQRQLVPRVKTTFLCGNHDEYFTRLLKAPRFNDSVPGDPNDPKDHKHCHSGADGSLAIKGLEGWLFSGGGLATLRNYYPELDLTLFDEANACINRQHPQFSVEHIEQVVKTAVDRVPQEHKDFFARAYQNSHAIIGDYLFTHAGVDPEKELGAQGIGAGAQTLAGTNAYMDFLMMRNPFLWREDDNLPHCPHIVVHGHTPSEIYSRLDQPLKHNSDAFKNDPTAFLVADGQKDYRLCLDTGVYKPEGGLTCFMREGDHTGFMTVTNKTPSVVIEYGISPGTQVTAAKYHELIHPEYHKKAAGVGR